MLLAAMVHGWLRAGLGWRQPSVTCTCHPLGFHIECQIGEAEQQILGGQSKMVPRELGLEVVAVLVLHGWHSMRPIHHAGRIGRPRCEVAEAVIPFDHGWHIAA